MMQGELTLFQRIALLLGLLLPLLIGAAGPLSAQAQPFAGGWTLQAESSALRFQSVKKSTVVESSSFATFTGSIDEAGNAVVTVALDSVDTKIDLRNVRMRFLFFETFKFPEATVTLQIDPAQIADLPTLRRKVMTVPYTLDLHGVTKELTAEIAVTLLSDDLISVASSTPISLGVADFGLQEGIVKLQEAANVDIVPTATVTFDFMFARNGTAAAPVVAAVAAPEAAPAAEPAASAALEAAGDFSPEACIGRFEILSRSGNIYFTPASARLSAESHALLDQVVDIVQRCPGLTVQIGGHTDSDGSDATNQRLSEARAKSVADYLARGGVDAARLRVVGFGEAQPITGNDTPEGKRRNRRIEFMAVAG